MVPYLTLTTFGVRIKSWEHQTENLKKNKKIILHTGTLALLTTFGVRIALRGRWKLTYWYLSSVGRATDWKSVCPWFDSWRYHECSEWELQKKHARKVCFFYAARHRIEACAEGPAGSFSNAWRYHIKHKNPLERAGLQFLKGIESSLS